MLEVASLIWQVSNLLVSQILVDCELRELSRLVIGHGSLCKRKKAISRSSAATTVIPRCWQRRISRGDPAGW
jgi:hypothetical protein